MPTSLIIFSLLIIIAFSTVVILFRNWLNKVADGQKINDELLAWLKSTNERLDTQNRSIITTLTESTKSLNERLDNAARFIASVQKNIGEMSEIGRGMKQLQEFMTSPKLRGNIGEQILKELLTQLLPKNSFHLQYSFKSGATVDAAIKLGNGVIIPIDSKFPMENFRKMINENQHNLRQQIEKEFIKDVRKHIDSISTKYILTDEGTTDYALMYIPSEAIYYEIANNLDLFEYASQRGVLPVSPTIFYAYLRAIITSLEGAKIQKQAIIILQIIRAIGKDYDKVKENLSVLSKHITNSYNQMNVVNTNFINLGQKLSTTKQIELPTEELKQIEKVT